MSRITTMLPAIATIMLLLCVTTIQCHNTTCDDYCTITIENDDHVITELKKNSKEILYLILHDQDRSPLFNLTDNTLFALAQMKFGLRFMVMPFDLILMSKFLSEVFLGDIKLNIRQYPDDCYIQLNSNQRNHCTFKALKRLNQQALNNCTGKTCGIFCSREINTYAPLDDIQALCCPMITEDEICNIEDRMPSFLVVFRYLSIIFSFILSANLLQWFISDVPVVQRKLNIGTSTKPEYVKLKLVSKYEYEGISNEGKRLLLWIICHLLVWIRYVILFILATLGFILSIWMQLYPYDFITVPKLFYMTYLIEIIKVVAPIICLNGSLMMIIILPLFHCGNQAVEDDIIHKDENICEHTKKHFVFRLSWYTDKWMKLASKLSNRHFCSIRLWWKLSTLLLVIICYLPFAAINKLSFGFTHNAIRNTDIIAYRLFQTFHCEGKHFSYKILMAKAIIYLITSLYYFTTMGFIWAFLQLLARMLLTYISIIAVHNRFFTKYIGPVLPFIYFAMQTILKYSEDKSSLSRDIFELRDEIESEVEDGLCASQGYLDILFIMTSKGIRVDLPVRLENLRDVIQTKFRLLAMDDDTVYRGEQQSVLIQFKEDGKDINGNRKYDIRFSRFDNQLNDLRNEINKELSHQQQQFLRINLKPFYYQLNDSTFIAADIGVPIKFYDYLYYCAPEIILNFRNLMFRLLTIASIAFFVFTAISSFSDTNDDSALTSAVSGTLLSYLGIAISIYSFVNKHLDDQKRREKLKIHIVNYILGYTFFYTTGNTALAKPSLHQTFNNEYRTSTKCKKNLSSTEV